jgi:hypothetical protein
MKGRPPPANAPAAPSTCTLLVQVIHTEWSKTARGGPLAVARNQVPTALPLTLPFLPANEASYLIHQVFYSEADGFQHPYHDTVEIRPARERTHYASKRSRPHALSVMMPNTMVVSEPVGEETIRYDRVNLDWSGDTITIGYGAIDGAPYTAPVTFTLEPDQWARIQYNARYAVDAGWVYDKWVFNLGLFHLPDSSAFLTTTPCKVLSRMSRLR